jgi:hypothetical protein
VQALVDLEVFKQSTQRKNSEQQRNQVMSEHQSQNSVQSLIHQLKKQSDKIGVKKELSIKQQLIQQLSSKQNAKLSESPSQSQLVSNYSQKNLDGSFQRRTKEEAKVSSNKVNQQIQLQQIKFNQLSQFAKCNLGQKLANQRPDSGAGTRAMYLI